MKQKVEPGPGQESVWDYPRPPKLEDCGKLIKVLFNDQEIARSNRTKRVLETSHPPVYYIPREDIKEKYLKPVAGTTYCEWKGEANYFDIKVGDQKASKAAWSYSDPVDRFRSIEGYVAFYAHKVDRCFVGDEQVDAQAGGFYGGWITSDIVGPFKGQPGSVGW